MLLGVLAPIALLSALLVFGVSLWAERSLEARLQGEIELIARAVAPSISNRLSEGSVIELRESLNSLFSIRRVYGVAVYNAAGELLLAAGAADDSVRNSRAASGVVASGRDEGVYRRVDGQNVYAYFTPLLDRDNSIQGLLQITRQRQEIDAAIARLQWTTWALWGLAVLVVIGITLQLHRRLVGSRVESLLQHIDRIAGGEREKPLHIDAPREFSDIADSLNSMVAATHAAEQALQKKQEEERALQRRLDRSERDAEIGRVTEGLAHELGAPLTVVDGRVRQLQREQGGEQRTRAMRDIREQVQRMTDIVRQVLSYGRRENTDTRDIDLAPLVQRLCDSHRDDRVDLSVTLDARSVIHGDMPRVEMAVSNLVRNALRHADTCVEVRVHSTSSGDVTVSVQDDGAGVPETDREEIFSPFFSREPTGEGSGLGLAIVSNIMREHGGSVHYRDTGKGATFELHFPPANHGNRA
jgi:signal transduction histidine kinase